MKLFRVECQVAATAYVKANTPEEARAAVVAEGEIDTDYDVSGLPFDHEDLPDFSVSPAMTIVSVDDDVEEVEDVD
ncbi:hypothetical protein [Sphingopyxis flava]|uniref:Uncharacterized protein n=1 Tax=Sphingopyxis flava TaxID=1507287 RepID=A0A1T5CU52_9SPHN|nr:hypothetical protein [Sphingopyxis flava]SKB63025.1 hypothetical protein SAMN06295937_1011123 [Sphingopyxis flava]